MDIKFLYFVLCIIFTIDLGSISPSSQSLGSVSKPSSLLHTHKKGNQPNDVLLQSGSRIIVSSVIGTSFGLAFGLNENIFNWIKFRVKPPINPHYVQLSVASLATFLSASLISTLAKRIQNTKID